MYKDKRRDRRAQSGKSASAHERVDVSFSGIATMCGFSHSVDARVFFLFLFLMAQGWEGWAKGKEERREGNRMLWPTHTDSASTHTQRKRQRLSPVCEATGMPFHYHSMATPAACETTSTDSVFPLSISLLTSQTNEVRLFEVKDLAGKERKGKRLHLIH